MNIDKLQLKINQLRIDLETEFNKLMKKIGSHTELPINFEKFDWKEKDNIINDLTAVEINIESRESYIMPCKIVGYREGLVLYWEDYHHSVYTINFKDIQSIEVCIDIIQDIKNKIKTKQINHV